MWHLTHRCHRRQFLLRFGRDQRLWTSWFYEARVRHRLCVLDYVVVGRSLAERVLRDLGGRDRRVEPFDDTYVVREPPPAYAPRFAPENAR